MVFSTSIFPLTGNAQSKKKQIEILKNRLDSVSVLIKIQNESNSKKTQNLNSVIIKLEDKINQLSKGKVIEQQKKKENQRGRN